MGGLHFNSLADLPEKMRAQVAGRLIGQSAAKKAQKYRNDPTMVSGIRFDSKKEADRYMQLMDAVREGVIYDLRLQRNYTLQEAYTTAEGERIVYQADFTYRIRWPWHTIPTGCSETDVGYWARKAASEGDGAEVIEDVKSKATRTRVYINKSKMMADKGWHIREV